jgi:hypothetical protein
MQLADHFDVLLKGTVNLSQFKLDTLDSPDHPVAHFHAYHAGRRASVSADGDVLAGSLESRALQFVREWAVLRHDEILANWDRARRNEPLLGIDPLA